MSYVAFMFLFWEVLCKFLLIFDDDFGLALVSDFSGQFSYRPVYGLSKMVLQPLKLLQDYLLCVAHFIFRSNGHSYPFKHLQQRFPATFPSHFLFTLNLRIHFPLYIKHDL